VNETSPSNLDRHATIRLSPAATQSVVANPELIGFDVAASTAAFLCPN
jgi:hypothetical protein